ncbi:THAP domain-containing protein 5-like [Linepithema humile]|uniref:THAP domain-containing protein 5-like n=1 Tax=Linepithema humile TaxID=83485 RepID=UPI00351DD04F
MPFKCAVLNCKSTAAYRKKNDKISFFKFPISIPYLLEQWIIAINRTNWIPTSSSRICQFHFTDSDFANTSKVRRLKADIIPTQNLYDQSSDKDSNSNECNSENLDVQTLSETDITAQYDTADTTYNTIQLDSNECNSENLDVQTLSETDITAQYDTADTTYNTIQLDSNECNSENLDVQTLSETDITAQYDTADTTYNTIQLGLTESQKRESTNILQRTNIKCRKLEDENKKLKAMISSLTQDYEKQLNNQADMFKTFIEKEKKNWKEKLVFEKNKIKLLNRKTNRKEIQIDNLIHKLKDSKTINDETYDMLSSDLGKVSSEIFKNDHKNKNKQKGRRYSEDIKRFALTLHYHSPKAYGYCKSACVFSSISFLKFFYALRSIHKYKLINYVYAHTHIYIYIYKYICI